MSGNSTSPRSQSPDKEFKPELQRLLWWLGNGRPRQASADRVDFFLPINQYIEFKLLSRVGIVDEDLRYDYDGDHETMTVRMHGLKRDIIVLKMKNSLDHAIDELKEHSDPAVAAFASSLYLSGATDAIEYPSGISTRATKRSPDITIRTTEHAGLPVVIGEVAFSEPTNKLQSLSKEYIQNTRGSTRTVLSIDLDYPTGKGARLSVWKAKLDGAGKFLGATCDDVVVIRSKDGVKNPDGKVGLVLSLEDFCPVGGVTDTAPLKPVTMTVSTDHLHEILVFAESQD